MYRSPTIVTVPFRWDTVAIVVPCLSLCKFVEGDRRKSEGWVCCRGVRASPDTVAYRPGKTKGVAPFHIWYEDCMAMKKMPFKLMIIIKCIILEEKNERWCTE